jgi:hypothetical protein
LDLGHPRFRFDQVPALAATASIGAIVPMSARGWLVVRLLAAIGGGTCHVHAQREAVATPTAKT